VPQRIETTEARKVAARLAGRQAGRRREAAASLRLAADLAASTARTLANGATPAEAREAALECAAEMVGVAEVLRWATRPTQRERQALAVRLARTGRWSRRQVADQVGVSERTVSRYLAGRRASSGQFRRPEG
jgi:hypothetical protein